MRRAWVLGMVAAGALTSAPAADAAIWLGWKDASVPAGAVVSAYTMTSDGGENGLLGRVNDGRATHIQVFLRVPGRRYDRHDVAGSVRRGALLRLGTLQNDEGVGRLRVRLPQGLTPGRYRPIVACRPCHNVFVGGRLLEVRA
jgi:hypothetical protein